MENKSIFPYSFVNTPDVSLDYKGAIPDYKHFSKVSESEYFDYVKICKGLWDLREETIKYCIQDCRTLYQIMIKFNDLIHSKFGVTIKKYPTLPSIAFGIYRANFLKHSIPKLTGDVYNFIRKSYTGGAVDVYKIRPAAGEIVRAYDVNSLYPTSMKAYNMPIGSPIFFEVSDPKFTLSDLKSLTKKGGETNRFFLSGN